MARPPHAPVWEPLADLFLDTEIRTWVPGVAASLLESELSVEEAGDVWRFEVTPAVYANLWSYTGEWGAFDRDWLERTIERGRGRWPNRPGVVGHVVYRVRVGPHHATWRAIEACMRHLSAHEASERDEEAACLRALAEHFYDFGAAPLPSARRPRARALWPVCFMAIFGRLTAERELEPGTTRVERALAA